MSNQFKPSTVSTPMSGDFKDIEAGAYPARVSGIYRVGTQPNDFPGAAKATKLEVIFQFELVTESITINGEELPKVKSKTFTDSLHEKGKLAPALAMLGLNSGEVDLTQALGRACIVNMVDYTKPDGTTAVKFASISQPMKGFEVPEGKLPLTFFDFNSNYSQEIVDSLKAQSKDGKMNWIYSKIETAPEFIVCNEEVPFV